MRFVSINHIKEGMVLSKPFYGSSFEVLLAEQSTLSAQHINRLNELGYGGAYIMDQRFSGVTVSDVISPERRIKTIKAAKEILQQAENGELGRGGKVPKARQEAIIMPLVEELIANQNRIVDTIDLKPYDDYTYYHAANVVVLSLLIGVELGLSGTQLYELGMATLLHDVGNIFVPKTILNKPGRLTPEEFDIIKQHSEKGFEYLRDNFDISIEACTGALQHHENFDGTGYPNKLSRDKISIYARIIAITDVYDALTSRRPYRNPMYPIAAMDFLNMNAGTMFDPVIVKAFQRVVSLYPSGVCVELNTGVRCLVLKNTIGQTDRPLLQMLGGMAKTPLYINLQSDPAFKNVYITKVLDA